jgi:hypothetical protein
LLPLFRTVSDCPISICVEPFFIDGTGGPINEGDYTEPWLHQLDIYLSMSGSGQREVSTMDRNGKMVRGAGSFYTSITMMGSVTG